MIINDLFNKKQGVAEGPNDGREDNFTINDIKRLEKIRDLETLKAQAKELIKGKPARRMKPEKISWFYNHIDTLKNPLAVIKMMYDLMLAGEGNKVIGSRNSMASNSYRTRFGEQDMAENQDWMKDLAARAAAKSKPGTPYVPPKQDAEKQRRDLTAKYPNIDELVAQAEKNRDPYYDRAEGEAYYRGREAEQNFQKLKQIQRVIQGLNESHNRTQP